jgi:hypothetical protein
MTAKTGNPVGRPKKKKLPVGRPKGEAAIMKDYRMSMLNSPKSPKVLKRILDAALDDDHKHQAVAWKLVVDRIAPLTNFTEASGKGTPKVEINITGLSSSVLSTDEAVDGEFEEVEGDA